MYENLDITTLFPAAEKFALQNDRYNYIPIYKTIELFCNENGLIFGGKIGVALLIAEPLNINIFIPWEIYYPVWQNENEKESRKKLNSLAIALTDKIFECDAPHIEVNLTALKTNIKYSDYTISVAGNIVAHLFLARREFVTLQRTSYFTSKKIDCVSPQFQLIDIYSELYSPVIGAQSKWPQLLAIEAALTKLISPENIIDKSELQFYEGNNFAPTNSINNIKKLFENLRRDELIDQFIFVGDIALVEMGILPNNYEVARIKVLSELQPDVFAKMLQIAGGYETQITFYEQQTFLLNDFRLKKYVFVRQGNFGRQIIAEFFNSPNYELVPWWPIKGKKSQGVSCKNILCGNPFVQLRFLYLELWFLRLAGIKRIGPIMQIAKKIILMRNLALETINVEPERIFQLRDYTGKNIAADIIKKQENAKKGRPIDYFPQKKNNWHV